MKSSTSGTIRADTAPFCNGIWNNFRDGEVTVGFLVDAAVFASSIVSVVTTRAQFLTGANGVCSLKYFSQSGDNSTVTSLEFARGFQLRYLQTIAPSAEPVVEGT